MNDIREHLKSIGTELRNAQNFMFSKKLDEASEKADKIDALIEEAQGNADEGVKVTSQVSTSFTAIRESAQKVAELVSEIASASREQTTGVDQISKAVTQMDQVVQQNAASTEESAAAAEELSAQAQELDKLVSDLVGVIDGARG